MTNAKHLKARIRARMARTGERYATARRHEVADTAPAVTDGGYQLRGGLHPETSNIANVAHHHGTELTEAMVLGVGGGLGAGYILWEFTACDKRALVLGFRHRWNYLDWTERTLDRLGLPYRVERTGGAKGAASRLTAALDEGLPAIVVPDRQLIGYWHMPEYFNGYGGHQLVVYGQSGGAARLDDRNLGVLTVEREVLDRARARVGSYQNYQVTITGGGQPDLARAAAAGIVECVDHLGAKSTSFAIPAWKKWASVVNDPKAKKGWPAVFADGRALATAMLSAWDEIEAIGMSGGNLRELYATFLDEARPLLGDPALGDAAQRFRAAAAAWHDVAECALPADVPEYARMRELAAGVAAAVSAGDEAAADRTAAAEELWELQEDYDAYPPAQPDFDELSARLSVVYEAERDAVAALAEVAHAHR